MEFPARLDVYVAFKKSAGRNIAKDIIESGAVSVNGKVVAKPGYKVLESDSIDIVCDKYIYVSRGGFKLEAALKGFNMDLKGLICLDAGASTGGFTECMLLNGAKLVYAIDSGSSQLHKSLKDNPSVISMENTDIRSVKKEDVPGVMFISADLSFISLDKIIDSLYNILEEGAFCVILIKPQFEAGIGAVNKKGIVKNAKTHYKILLNVYNYTVKAGFSFMGLMTSPICGGDGNREFLGLLKKESGNRGLSFNEYCILAREGVNIL